MNLLAEVAARTEPPDPSIVTPGVEGFIAFGVLALMVIGLVLLMSRQLRRIDTRVAHQQAEEVAAARQDERANPDQS